MHTEIPVAVRLRFSAEFFTVFFKYRPFFAVFFLSAHLFLKRA